MAYVLGRAKVADYAAWARAFEGTAAMRRANGSRGSWIFQSANDPQEIMVLFDAENGEMARRFFDSAETLEKMRQSGVIEHEVYADPVHIEA
jgi:hypothetical protein